MSHWHRRATIRGLMITRGQGQKIIVNNGEIVIEVVQIRGKQVRLCFEASKEITIKREPTTEGSGEDDSSER